MADATIASNKFGSKSEANAPKGKKTAKAESQTLVAANGQRVELYVANPSAKEVWLALGATAAKEEGIYLKKEGGAVIITGYTGVVSVITTEGEGSISFAEV